MENKYNRVVIAFYRIFEVMFFIYFKFKRIVLKKTDLRIQNKFKIIIIEPYQLGDVVSLATIFDPIIENFPFAEISIIVKKSNRDVFINDKRITNIYCIDLPWTKHGKWSLSLLNIFRIKSILPEKISGYFDFGLDPRGDLKSQIILKNIGCRKVIGYNKGIGSNIVLKGLLLDSIIQENCKYTHRYERNRYILTAMDISESKLFPIQFPTLVNINVGFTTLKYQVVIHIGSGWIYRRWKTNKWLKLISFIINKGFDVLVIAGESESFQLEEIQSKLANCKLNFWVPNTLHEMFNIIENCTYFIGLDSGPLHIADSYNKPCLALFGPGNSEIWRPLSFNSYYLHNYGDFDCHPCNQRNCIYPEFNCMDSIDSDNAIQQFQKMIS